MVLPRQAGTLRKIPYSDALGVWLRFVLRGGRVIMTGLRSGRAWTGRIHGAERSAGSGYREEGNWREDCRPLEIQWQGWVGERRREGQSEARLAQ